MACFSPNSDPIEMVWNWMKILIQDRYLEDSQLFYNCLREIVRAVWEAVPESFLQELTKSIPAKWQAAIKANNSHIKYQVKNQ